VLPAVCFVTTRLNIADFFCCTTSNPVVDNSRSVAFTPIDTCLSASLQSFPVHAWVGEHGEGVVKDLMCKHLQGKFYRLRKIRESFPSQSPAHIVLGARIPDVHG
jgi:hypothetical protein